MSSGKFADRECIIVRAQFWPVDPAGLQVVSDPPSGALRSHLIETNIGPVSAHDFVHCLWIDLSGADRDCGHVCQGISLGQFTAFNLPVPFNCRRFDGLGRRAAQTHQGR